MGNETQTCNNIIIVSVTRQSVEGHDVGRLDNNDNAKGTQDDSKTPVENEDLQNGTGKLKVAPKGSSGNKNETQCSLIMFCNYMTFHDTRRTDRSYKVSGYPFNGLSIKGPYYLERFLSCMAFSVYEVVRVACQSRSWFVYASRETSAARKRNIMPLKYL